MDTMTPQQVLERRILSNTRCIVLLITRPDKYETTFMLHVIADGVVCFLEAKRFAQDSGDTKLLTDAERNLNDAYSLWRERNP